MQKIDEVNEQEAAYGWDLSQYPVRKQCHDKLVPYKRLFDAGQEFMDQYDLWMNSQCGTHDPEKIEETVGSLNRIVLKLERQLADKPQTLKLAQDVREPTTILRNINFFFI
jgi:dynein heavy chain, axonemal